MPRRPAKPNVGFSAASWWLQGALRLLAVAEVRHVLEGLGLDWLALQAVADGTTGSGARVRTRLARLILSNHRPAALLQSSQSHCQRLESGGGQSIDGSTRQL